ncbi:SurA N-terminal domain-containing protein [Pseudoalteromonas denitrificans]|uniref:Periplasmic chaperone PpiD n=1 Tax=Pseudoalteromonas denitrificans DSM 6059 TaxID=1123010 RepID=A0A1I1QQG5_9GAMM|nr:SurA N-terminal domain-containing protein [Pseudoalteromonas denitrificans]SFD24351.1 peptidyl-prolyl cis-trans isomerase D [Pseudoalteromonas denitrificans DSM 6059]
MLERIREGSQGVVAKIVLGLVMLSFALAGIGSYLGQPADQSVAVVNGKKISQVTFSRAYENERSRLERQMGEYFTQISSDPTYMARVRENVIERLVQQELQTQLAHELGLRVSDKALKDEIRGLPYFQVAGQFNNDRYIQVIRQMNFQPDAFRDYLRTEMTRSQLVAAVAGTDFALTGEVASATQLEAQLRDIEYLLISADKVKAGIEVSESEISDYYTLNQAQFMSQEQVSVEYVELTSDTIKLEKEISEQDIAAAYEENKAQYIEPEKRRVAHILIDNSEDDTAAKIKAEAVLAKLNAGEGFELLAKTESDDIVSGEVGGDLDWIDRDMMDPAFEDAAFALTAKGDISEVVKSEFGYHIIKLTDLLAEQVKTIEQVKDELKANLEKDAKSELFYGMQTELAELAFEVADSLEDAAGATNQEVKTTALFNRYNAPVSVNNPAVVKAAFSAELIEDGVNSEVIELGDEHVIVVRIKEHKPAATKPISDVSEQIKTRLVSEKAAELTKEKSDALYAKVQTGISLNDIAKEEEIELKQVAGLKRDDRTVSTQIVQNIFKLAHPKSDAVTDLVSLNNGDVAIVALTKVTTAEPVPVEAQVKQSFATQQINKNYLVFVNALKADAEVVSAKVAVSEQN